MVHKSIGLLKMRCDAYEKGDKVYIAILIVGYENISFSFGLLIEKDHFQVCLPSYIEWRWVVPTKIIFCNRGQYRNSGWNSELLNRFQVMSRLAVGRFCYFVPILEQSI